MLMLTGVSSCSDVTEMSMERYTRLLMDASPEFPIHFLNIYSAYDGAYVDAKPGPLPLRSFKPAHGFLRWRPHVRRAAAGGRARLWADLRAALRARGVDR